MTCVYSIGHSNHSDEHFVSLLVSAGVTAVADVRSSPYSRFNPQFNRETLSKTLKANGIDYVFLGAELGARSDDKTCYVGGRVQYGRLAMTPLFQSGLDRIQSGASKRNIALLCAEKEPLDCHRTLLVSTALAKRNVQVVHILADGSVEEHQQTLLRLLPLVDVPERDLFRSTEQLIELAVKLQEEKIAYVAAEPEMETTS